jgi:hypothetical protein
MEERRSGGLERCQEKMVKRGQYKSGNSLVGSAGYVVAGCDLWVSCDQEDL